MKLFGSTNIKWLINIICLIIVPFNALADEESRNFRAYSTELMIPGAAIQSMDDKYTSSSTWASGFTILNNKTVVELGLDGDKHTAHTYFRTQVTFDIALTNLTQGVTILTSQQLEINYDPSDRTRYADKAQLLFNGYYKIKVYNVSFLTYDASNNLISNSLIPDVYVQAEVVTNKAYPFSLASTALLLNQYNKVFINLNNELEINWDFVKGATEYELEYTYVDDYDFNTVSFVSTSKNPANISYNLKNDGTRILTPFNFFRIPLNYERGYIIYRIRPVTEDVAGNRLDGAWTGIPESGTVQNLLSSFPASVYALTTAYYPNINWVSTKTFAEDGKAGTGISYVDAVGLMRQKIARLNTDNKSIVQSTLYDHYGRPKYNILPAPVSGLNFNYRTSLNMYNNGSGPVVFDKKTFDLCSSNNPCTNGSFILNSASSLGAASYYSTVNGNKNSQQGFIPDSKGMPFIEVKYTPDMTGRILKQSLPGSAHHTGASTGRAIQYFYSHPTQIEMDRLFGKEAGPVSKYTKNFVIDPNGQTSTSYIDMKGRTVASALVGDPPPGIDQNPDNTGLVSLTEDMAIPTTNIADNANHCIEVNTSFFVPATNTQEVFQYSTTLGKFFPDICGVGGSPALCLDCVYDLEISIKDACGNDMFYDDDNNPSTNSNPVKITIGANPSLVTNKYENNCVTGEYTGVLPGSLTKTTPYQVSNTPITIIFPHIGTYEISKKICVSDKPIQDYIDLFEAEENNCANKYCDVVDSIIGTINFNSSCATQLSCQACIESLSTYTANSNNPPLSSAQFNTLMGNCKLMCPPNTCENLSKTMAADFIPGTGYFAVTSPTDPNWPYSIFNSGNVLQNSSGLGSTWNNPPLLSSTNHPYKDNSGNNATVTINSTVLFPEQLSVTEFTTNFQLSWASAFLPIHPEYCKMKFYCDIAGASADYNDNMQKYKHYSEACAIGILKPYVASFPYGPNTCLAASDPIFAIADPLYTTLINAFINEITTSFAGTGKNIYQIASENVYGGPVPVGHTFGSDPCNSDMEWVQFMELYLTLKTQLFDDMLVVYKQNFISSGVGECSINLPPNYVSNFPDNSNIMALFGINPTWTSPANNSQLNNAASTNIAANCVSQCASYAPLWEAELTNNCVNYSNLTQAQKNNILNAFEAICNLGCDANHSLGSSSTPGTTVFHTLPGTSVNVYNFQDVLNYYMNLYQSSTCSSYLVSEPELYVNSGFKDSETTVLNDCKCDQLLKVKYDLANNNNVPSGITEAWQLFKHRYGFDLGDYNKAICECEEAIHQQGIALTPPITNLTWSPGFSWDNTSRFFLSNNILNIDSKLSCDRCVNCADISSKMDALYTSLPNSGAGANVFLAVTFDNANATYLVNYLNTNNAWFYTKNDYLEFYSACTSFTTNGNITSFMTDEAGSIANYFDELAGNGQLTKNHTMKLCTDGKYFLSNLYKDAPLPIPVADIWDYQVTPQSGNALQIIFKLNTIPKCTFNLTLPLPTLWSDIKSITGLIAYCPPPVTGGVQYGFKLFALDQNFQQVIVTGSSSCYSITSLSNSVPYMPVKCPKPPENLQNCQINLIKGAMLAAVNVYEEYKTSKTTEFVKAYKDACFSRLNETFTRQYNLQEFHYTLFYYDEAGNLQRTVAPKGVVPLNITTNTPPTNLYPQHSSVNCVDLNYVNQTKFNTLNQILSEKTVDGGETKFYYEKTGRLRASQNAKQAAKSLANGTFIYSYTLYDKLSRIVENGEIESPSALTQAVLDQPYTNPPSGVTFDDFCTSATKREIVNTTYDKQISVTAILNKFTNSSQKNLRNRVAYTTYRDVVSSDYKHATFYSYDEHGNVSEVVQHNKALDLRFGTASSLKKIKYEYELISGNMNKVIYQPGEADQFMHKYYYDDDNRLHEVYSSKDDINWDRDAKYFYYEHGPLARIERADEQVQGMDYFFTIHGWIKGINSDVLGAKNDAGKDAATGNAYNSNNPDIHNWFAKDAMAYSLNYYKTGTVKDYEAINRNNYTSSGPIQNPLSDYANIISGGPFNLTSDGADLYNGNISSMVTSFIDKDPIGNDHSDNLAFPQLTGYRYDQLQRITQMKSFRDILGNGWQTSTTPNYDGSYLMLLSYDKNGNIINLKRDGAGNTIKAGSLLAMDDLNYTYAEQPVFGFPNTNKLIYIKEAATSSAYTEDIKAPSSAFASTTYYDYDEIGNLIKDKNECIGNIEWTADRKVKKITRDIAQLLATASNKSDLEYEYNAQRQRVAKIVKPRHPVTKILKPSKDWLYTYYVYDAGGNVAAIYNRSSVLDNTYQGGTTYKDILNLGEHHLYGSERLAITRPTAPYEWALNFVNCGGAIGECQNAPFAFTSPTPLNTTIAKRFLGYKEFELNNHLGNVIATVSDRKVMEWANQLFNDDFTSALNGWINGTLAAGQLAVTTNVINFGAEKTFATVVGKTYRVRFNLTKPVGSVITAEVNPFPITPPALANITAVNGYNEIIFTATTAQSVIRIRKANAPGTTITFNIDNVIVDESVNYMADILMHMDYYAFGNKMPSRTWLGTSDKYRYSHNGHEAEDEIYIGSQSAEFWSYDGRIGRRWEMDAVRRPFESPYATFGDNPIINVDRNGLDWFYYLKAGETSPTWHWHNTSKLLLITSVSTKGSVRHTLVHGYKAVVIFNGNRQEALGSNKAIDGPGAVNAQVTVYGPGGESDIENYTGYTMTSDAVAYTPIDEGLYMAERRSWAGTGSIPKHYIVNNGGEVPTMDGKENANPERDSKFSKNKIAVHGTLGENNVVGGKTSKGCLLILGSEIESFDTQLSPIGNGEEFLLILNRAGSDHNPIMTFPHEVLDMLNSAVLNAVSTFIGVMVMNPSAPASQPSYH